MSESESSLRDAVPADPTGSSRARSTLSLWLALAATTAYLCRMCLPVVEKTIRTDLDLSEQQMGMLMGSFFWAYALAQIPAGWLGQKLGSRWILAAYSLIWSLGTACWGFAEGFAVLLIGRIGVGLAQGGLFPCAAHTISRWYPLSERATVSGILGGSMQIGALIATFLTVALVDPEGWSMRWQSVFVWYSVPGVLWSIGFYLWFRDSPREHRSVNSAELDLIEQGRSDPRDTDSAASVPWLRLLASLPMWMICAQQFFRAAGYVWFSSWFATYLQETRNVTQTAAGWLLAIPLLAALLGALISGTVSDLILRRTGNRGLARKSLAATSLFICAALVSSAFFVEHAAAATCLIGLGAFFAAFAGPCAYSVSMDMGGAHVTSVFATMNMVGNFGAGLLAWFVPHYRKFIERSPDLNSLLGENSWNGILVLFALMYLLAAMFWLCLRTEGTVFDSNDRQRR
jgi:MFS transporter, ACS family, D-galactonate transporter